MRSSASIRLALFGFVCLLSLPTPPAHAEIQLCAKQAATDKCGQCEPKLVNIVRAFVNEVRDQKRAILTGDHFLQELKEVAPILFDNYIIMEHSDSQQASSMGFPRILLKSPDAEVLLGFGTDKSLSGYERMEVVLWKGGEARWEYLDLTFPQDMPFGARLDYLEKTGFNHKPALTPNPQLCAKCHSIYGGDLKPIWDSYYFWAGQLPFRQDLLIAGTNEVERYVDFYRTLWPRDPRLKLLRMPKDVAQHLKTGFPFANDRRGEIKDPTVPVEFVHKIEHNGGQAFITIDNGPGSILLNQLQALNLCRISWKVKESKIPEGRLKDQPLYDRVKYAVAGAIEVLPSRLFNPDEKYMGCQNYEKFFPEWVTRKAIQHFSVSEQFLTLDRKPVPAITGSDYASLYQSIRANTKIRQDFQQSEKLERHRKHLIDHVFKEPKLADNELDYVKKVVGIEDREVSLGHMTKLRYVLEPWGMDLRQWSLSRTPDTYTLGDFALKQALPKTQIATEVHAEWKAERAPGESFCDWAAKKSRAAYGEEPWVELTSAAGSKDPQSGNAGGASLTRISADEVKNFKFPDSCVACHVKTPTRTLDKTAIPFTIPAREISFENPGQLLNELGDTKDGLQAKIIDRINRPDGDPGHMPYKSFRQLTDKDKSLIKAYLEYLLDPSTIQKYP